MELETLSVTPREASGTGGARRTRAAGNVPGIVYGEGAKNLNIHIDAKIFDRLLHGRQGEHAIVNLEVDGEPSLNGPALIRQVQHHPVKGHAIHADFYRIDLNKKIQTVVPVITAGRAKGVIDGGLLDHQCREVEVECLALNVPTEIKADVTKMVIGDSLHVSDLPIPQGVTILTSPERAVVAIHAPRVAKKTEEEEAEEAAEATAEPAAE